MDSSKLSDQNEDKVDEFYEKYDYVLVGSGLYAGVWAYEAKSVENLSGCGKTRSYRRKCVL